jgi:hypothetical protein
MKDWFQVQGNWPNSRSERFMPMFSSKSFTVFTLKFRPLIQFKLHLCLV